ncbi:MAG TPA: sensor domain-containing diguanylate cyclase [Solirubrobacteraceae bacterium]
MGDLSPASRRALVEEIFRVQSLVVRGVPLPMLHQAVLDGGLRLLDADAGSLRFLDTEDPSWMVAVAVRGSAGSGERWRHRTPITEGLSGQVITTGEIVALESDQPTRPGSHLAPADTQAMLGVPVVGHTQVIGSLVVASVLAPREWTPEEREVLSVYAAHVGMAITVAGASHAVREARMDPLTGLGNRARLLDRLDHELVRADRGGDPASVLFIDLDGFKLVNDSLGHSAGDDLLMAAAERLRGCTRESDICARVGGDEFSVLITSEGNPVRAAERILDALGQPFRIGAHEVQISASVGIATGQEEAETLLRNADAAMYHAKRAGSGRYELFRPGMGEALLA